MASVGCGKSLCRVVQGHRTLVDLAADITRQLLAFIRNGAWAKGEVQLFATGVERAVSRPVRRTWFQNEIRACAVSASIRWNNCLQDIVEGMVRALINFECSLHLEAQENKSLGPCFEKTKTTRHCQHFQPRAPGPLCSADVLPPTLSSPRKHLTTNSVSCVLFWKTICPDGDLCSI